mgnify:FL=1|tara:strand:+ start:819 stop:1082 length:264 start_codon:yes stop_codon:yes gene_type:complete
MIKNILNKIWNFSLKKGWDFIWSKTTIDEKAIEIIKETKARSKVVKKEMADVKKEIKQVIKQSKDIAGAVKGAKRKGRPIKTTKDKK